MNRREFFSRFASVPIAASLAIPELTRTIFLPPRNGWVFSTKDLALSLEDFERLIIEPAARKVAYRIDIDLIYGYGRIYI